jgi:hypothetical protein
MKITQRTSRTSLPQGKVCELRDPSLGRAAAVRRRRQPRKIMADANGSSAMEKLATSATKTAAEGLSKVVCIHWVSDKCSACALSSLC